MITEIAVEEVDPDQYVMVADGITAKKTEDRMVPEKMTVMCFRCTFNFADLMMGQDNLAFLAYKIVILETGNKRTTYCIIYCWFFICLAWCVFFIFT